MNEFYGGIIYLFVIVVSLYSELISKLFEERLSVSHYSLLLLILVSEELTFRWMLLLKN